jgi:membrane fusion protein (multidrug efflux system)
VWVADKDGKAENRPVTVGDWVGNDWHIVEGLHAGDRVVVDGGLKLGAGAPLNVKPLAPSAAAPAAPAVSKPAPKPAAK